MKPYPIPLAFTPDQATGYICNEGTQRYLLEAESTSGYTCWRLADGTNLISESIQVSLPASEFVDFWPCAGYQDMSPAGRITSFDCHGNGIIVFCPERLCGLEYLDCSYNLIRDLTLDGLTELQSLNVSNNQLRNLKVRGLKSLRMLNCSDDHLWDLDVSGLEALEILDASGNLLDTFLHDGCTSLRDVKVVMNPKSTQSSTNT